MIPLTDKENKPYHKRKLVIYAYTENTENTEKIYRVSSTN